jgi:hypothetical protein
MMGRSFVSGSGSGSGSGSSKGKERSPLDYDSGRSLLSISCFLLFSCRTMLMGLKGCTSTPSSMETVPENAMLGSKTDLTGLWDVVAQSERARHASSTATTSPAESSKDGAAREMRTDEA